MTDDDRTGDINISRIPVAKASSNRRPLSTDERLKIFDEGTTRQVARNKAWRRQHGAPALSERRRVEGKAASDRGWTRE